jgi:hypothetical protein
MQLDALRTIFEESGPYLTIHAEVGRTSQDALDALDSRWTSIRHDLEHHDVDGGLVEEIGERLHANTHVDGEVRRTIVAVDDHIVFDDLQAGHSMWPETVDFADLPDLSGWLRLADAEVPFVLVNVDRSGGDVDFYRARARPRTEHESVEGEAFYITKVPEGDWSNKRYQRGAEELWKENAGQVAEVVIGLVREHHPAAVLVAGDVRAVQELTDALADTRATVVRLESGGRAEGTSEKALWSEVDRVLADLEAHRQQSVADRLAQAAGRDDGAAVGTDAVLDALVRRQVDQLVLDLDEASRQQVSPAEHEGLVVPESARNSPELPADRVLVAAAALSDSGLALIPAELAPGDGIAALLRWSD